MTDFYIKQIQDGKMKIEDVPPLWRAQVEKKIKKGNN